MMNRVYTGGSFEGRLVGDPDRGREETAGPGPNGVEMVEATPFSCKYDVAACKGGWPVVYVAQCRLLAPRGPRRASRWCTEPEPEGEEGYMVPRCWWWLRRRRRSEGGGRPPVKYISRCVTSRGSHKSRDPPSLPAKPRCGCTYVHVAATTSTPSSRASDPEVVGDPAKLTGGGCFLRSGQCLIGYTRVSMFLEYSRVPGFKQLLSGKFLTDFRKYRSIWADFFEVSRRFRGLCTEHVFD